MTDEIQFKMDLLTKENTIGMLRRELDKCKLYMLKATELLENIESERQQKVMEPFMLDYDKEMERDGRLYKAYQYVSYSKYGLKCDVPEENN